MNNPGTIQIVWNHNGSKIILTTQYIALFGGWKLQLQKEDKKGNVTSVPLCPALATASGLVSMRAICLMQEMGK